MKKLFLIFLIFPLCVSASDIKEVWKILESQDRVKAREMLTKALSDPETKVDAALTLILLNDVENKKDNLPLMKQIYASVNDPSPYLYSLWFDNAVTGGYQKKEDDRFDALTNMLLSSKVNGSIRGGAQYIFSLHYVFSNKMEDAVKIGSQVGSLKNWQFTGPFDNSSGSGFNKNYPPIDDPKPEARFTSTTNSEIYWFSPLNVQQDPWVSTNVHIPTKQGITYAQSFVTSPVDQEVILALGESGSIKVWVNDELLIQNEEEWSTEMDVFKVPVKLNKGYNRILVQLGFTGNTAYPNFLIRLLDEHLELVKGLTSTSDYKPYVKASSSNPKPSIQHFAEAYFENKIKEQPSNLINYILLSKAYTRKKDFNRAIDVLNKALALYPNNILLNYELLITYNKIDNRTELLKQVEDVRKLDPKMQILKYYDFNVAFDKGNYTEAEGVLNELKSIVGENDEDYLESYIKLLGGKKDYQTLVSVAEKAFKDYPENSSFLTYKYYILKNKRNSSSEAAQLLENYLKTNYNAKIYDLLITDYSNSGNKVKLEQLLVKLHEYNPEEFSFVDKLSNYYYKVEKYKKGLDNIELGLKNAPFRSSYWSDKSYFHEALNMKNEAINDLKKAIHYNPNLFDARERLRELQGMKPLVSYFKDDAAYSEIEKEMAKEIKGDDNFEYIFYNQSFAVFPEGASVEYTSMAMRMFNNSGLERWKETSIPYNNNWENLIIEKAQVIKKNGQKVEAEKNYNNLVFPSLEVGDAIYIEYRLENYTEGKLRKEFWHNFVFNDYVPTLKSKFKILTPRNYYFNIKTNLISKQADTTNVDDFKSYEWSFTNPDKCISESYMPNLKEVGMALDISTVKSWKTISQWYSDLVMPMAKEDFNLGKAYNSIFAGKNYTTYEKVQAIYDYICDNIRYSSVDFRQGNYVPQKPMITLSTQLGDCKDLSTLYFTLARKAGIKTNLVLVNTRDYGENSLKLPSTDFNHCIVRIEIDGKFLFLELTDPNLPFGYLPNDDVNAQALIIPNAENDAVGDSLIHIPNSSVGVNAIKRKAIVKVKDNKLEITTDQVNKGTMAADKRSAYKGLTATETKEKMKETLGNRFSSPITLVSYNFENLENKKDEVIISNTFSVDNGVIKIGGLKAIKPVFFEDIFTSDAFTEEKRVYPINYWKYEIVDTYETEITYELPADKSFIELPADFKIEKPFISYSLKIVKEGPAKVRIIRKVNTKNSTIPASSYDDFKQTLNEIVKAEDIYLAFK